MQQTPPEIPANVFPAGDEPQQIEPDLWRIPVPLPFALRSANIYLIADGAGGWILVDSGLGLPADEAALHTGLARAGVGVAQITTLILTHAHPDHIGLSGIIRAASGAPIYMLEGEDDRLYDVWTDSAADALPAVTRMYAVNGLSPTEAAAARLATLRIRQILRLPPRPAIRLVSDGADLSLGTHSYRAIWTPGHSDYHMCLLRDDGLFIAGDHILPAITPNIGYYPEARPNPLHDYFAALARVRDLPVRLVLPGHGRPFAELAARVDALREHHEERSAQILALLRAQPSGADGATLARVLFGLRLRSPDDWRFALVETLAHLEYLRHMGKATRAERGGHITYTATATPAARPIVSAPPAHSEE